MSEAVVLRYVRLAGRHEPPGRIPIEGEYLTSYDPDAHGGRGDASFDPAPDRAIRFPDAETAGRLAGQVSSVRPVREDGEPNRPLTAYTLAVVKDPLGRQPNPPEPDDR